MKPDTLFVAVGCLWLSVVIGFGGLIGAALVKYVFT